MSNDWLARLERGPLRRHYDVFFGVVIAGLVVTAIVSAATVISAASMVRSQAQLVAQLQTENADVMQDATVAYFGLHEVGTVQPAEDTAGYDGIVGHLRSDQKALKDLLADEPQVRKAVDRQDRAIQTWIDEYAEPLAAGTATGDPGEFAELGQDLFKKIRDANAAVDEHIDTLGTESRSRTGTIMLVALSVVTLLPLLAVGGVVYLGRRLSRSVVGPLHGITGVLDRLRAGEPDARAEVTGPDEVRQIAAGLNLLTEENLRASEVEADVLLQLQSIDRVRTDLVSTVSHELRTPLASIKGYLELLQDELLDVMTPQQSSMVGAIRRNLDRLNDLIANLLALSRAEETELALQPVDLRAIATEVGTDIRLTAAGRDVSIRMSQSAGPVVVMGDRSQLIRAVQNLVTNAVKFSRPGGTVEIRVHQEGPHAVLDVIDEGIGIPAADLPGLGSRFYRASNAVQAEIAGTGLGLRIVQTILGRHGGELAVESVEGEGTTFTVQLELARTVGGDAAVLEAPLPGGLPGARYGDPVPEPA
jgi:two-component system, OmpR family, sensor kinase